MAASNAKRKTRARDISFRAELNAPFASSCVVAVTAFPRAIVIVLDSVGIGELPDAAAYGDEGSDTLGNIARQMPLRLPTLRALGLGRVAAHRRGDACRRASWPPSAAWPKRRPARTRSPATGR